MTKLFIVATPIGNLEDISSRALTTLKKVDLIAAEDTRVTGKLLSKFGIDTPQISFNAHNAAIRTPKLLLEMKTKDIALTTDAGSPGVSDPGRELIQAADKNGIEIITIPGPSSLTAIMSISPFNTHKTYFHGFCPQTQSEIAKILSVCNTMESNCVFYESPKRLRRLLTNIASISENREILIGRELTKFHEERFIGTVKSALKYFIEPKGEFTILIKPEEPSKPMFSCKDFKKLVKEFRSDGLGVKEVAKEISKLTGKTNSQAYRIVLDNI